MSDEGFLSRWARRKAADRQGIALPEPDVRRPAPAPPVPAPVASVPAAAPAPPHGVPAETASPATEPPVPTLDDVAKLCPADDFAPFVARGVPAEVKAAAMKKLFADPHYNIMDGLDIYIDDYTRPDPIPLAMLKQLNQSKVLRLFESDDESQQEGADEAGHVQVEAQAGDADPAAAVPADSAAGVSARHAGMAPDDAATDPQRRSAPETRVEASTRDIIGINNSEQKPDRRT
ncbi:DUF3306 domain-containing protein [Imbroritus primus]|uniref:DUF3306 domain-containing protein n=1 Tax=Imbroritus primus TaxID=3058603 RepID=UPI003D160417